MALAEFDQLRPRDFYLGEGWQADRNGLFLPPRGSGRWRYGPKPIGIDLFSGCGGFSLGFMQAGFRVVAAAEWEPYAALTYMHNLGTYPIDIHYVDAGDKDRLEGALREQMKIDARANAPQQLILSGHGWIKNRADVEGCPHFWFGDIRKVNGKDMLDAMGLDVGEVDCVFGGPPCQGFSLANKNRRQGGNVMDPRNSLVFEFVRLILQIRPKTMVMENVPGIISMVTPEGTPVVDAICRILADGEFGSYEALKRGLLATAGLKPGAVLSGQQTAGGARAEDAEPEALQEALF